MGRASLQMSAFLRSSVSLALASVMVVGAGAAETPKGGAAAATGTLSVTTDPDNAAVYIDGRLAGQTPASVASVSAGEHRVRIVKSGYLENARVVNVPAGQPTKINVKLTRTSTASEPAASQVSSTGGGGGGGIPKWVWFAAGGGAAVVAAVVLAGKNDPPTAGTITVSPNATGMAGQTSFTFTSTGASDPDKDTLTKTWSSSDGGTGSGDTFAHTFATAGTFQVTLKVSDGKHDVNAPAASVTVGPNLAGTWTGGTILMPNQAGALTLSCGLSLTLSQSGTTLSGAMPLSGNCSGSLNLQSGSASVLTHPAGISLATAAFNFTSGTTLFPNLVISFSGTTNTAGTTMTGNVTLSQASSGFSATSSTTFTKQ